MKGKSFPAVVVCLFLVFAANAQNILSVDEKISNAVLLENSAEISLRIENSKKRFSGTISLELLDTEGKIRAGSFQKREIQKRRGNS